jgi:hypothetical protein
MTYNEAYEIVIRKMISDATNNYYILVLENILKEIEGKKHIEEMSHPRHLSIVELGINIFPFSDDSYVEIANEILKGKNNG